MREEAFGTVKWLVVAAWHLSHVRKDFILVLFRCAFQLQEVQSFGCSVTQTELFNTTVFAFATLRQCGEKRQENIREISSPLN
jgi:hypothetical protein